MKKKLLAMLLAFSMVFGSVITIQAETTETAATTSADAAVTGENAEPKWGFDDVPNESINGAAILELTKSGVINGYEDGSFKPENEVTRAEFVKMLVELAGWTEIYNSTTTGFPDVDAADGEEAHWAAKYIHAAVSQKIINGYDDGTFKPDNPVKYEEAIKMMVCYLGREGVAQKRVETNPGTKLYPDAYLYVGTTLSLTNLVSCSTGEYINRAMVAQVMYNGKGVGRLQPIVAGSSGGSSGGGSSGGSNSNSKLVPGKKDGVSGSLVAYGMVVAVKETVGNDSIIQSIDDNILTYDGENGENLRNGQIIIKCDSAFRGDGSNYIRVDSRGYSENHSGMLGHHVKVDVYYDNMDDVYYITSIKRHESKNLVYTSLDIDFSETALNPSSNTVFFNEEIRNSENRAYVQYVAPSDPESLNIIYNGHLVDVDAIKAAQAPSTDPVITFNDFIPQNGQVEIIEYQGATTLIRMTSVDTYYISSAPNASTGIATDKYRKDASGNAVTIDLIDSSKEIYVSKNGEEVTTISSLNNNILQTMTSKCGKFMNVTAFRPVSSRLKVLKIDGDIYTLGTAQNNTEYFASDYFLDYVLPNMTDPIEIDSTYTVYFDTDKLSAKSKILYVTKTQAVMNDGYLGQAKSYTDGVDQILQFHIHKAATSSNLTNVAPTVFNFDRAVKINGVKYTDIDAIVAKLSETAAIINDGKAAKYIQNAETAQPIRYVVEGSVLKEIETIELDIAHKFTGTPMKFKSYISSASRFIANEDTDNEIEISVDKNSTFIYVTNNRTDSSANYLKYGKLSSLVDGSYYNVDPFWVVDGENRYRRLYVVYNQSIDEQPTHSSQNVIISKIEPTTEHTTISYYSNTSSGSINVEDPARVENAYIMDSNFTPTGERRALKVGDVVRYGISPTGQPINFQILYNIDDDLDNVKGILIDKNLNSSTDFATFDDLEEEEADIKYYTRIGMVDDNNISASDGGLNVSFIVNEGTAENPSYTKHTSYISFSSGNLGSTRIVMYDMTANKPEVSTKNGTLTWKLSDVSPGDMIYVWRGEQGAYKGLYVIRYKDVDVLAKADALLNPPADPLPDDPGADSQPPASGDDVA